MFVPSELTQMHVMLNDVRYPARDKIVSFGSRKYIEHYKSFVNFGRDYYGMDTLTSPSSIDPMAYNKDMYPILHFDVSKQS